MNLQPSYARYPTTWEANLLVAGLLVLVLILVGAASASFTVISLPMVLICSQLFIIVPSLLWLALRRWPLRQTLRLHPIGRYTALWSLLVGLVCWPVVVGLATLLEWVLALIGPGPQLPWPKDWVESGVYALVFIILAPLTEEPIFRGLVLSAWLRRGTVPGLMVAGLLFGLLHAQLASVIPLTLFGIALSLLAQRSQSIYSSGIAHMGYNTLGTVFLVSSSLRDTPEWHLVVVGAIALPLVGWLLWLFARRCPGSRVERPPQEPFSWVWPVLSLLVPLGVFGLVALGELLLRFSPDLAGIFGYMTG